MSELSAETWLNQIIHGDALKVMSRIPRGLVRLALTSPPYNLRNSSGNGMTSRKSHGKWPSSKLREGYSEYDDNMPDDLYVEWQREIIAAMLDLMPDDGAVFYNHKRRVQNGLLQDRDDIVDGFPVRQIIVWDREGGINHNEGYFIPAHELIYLIAKPRFRLSAQGRTLTDVWRIRPDRNNPHPAPFPLELAHRVIASTDAQVVLDPFMGSGTTGLAAASLGRSYVGIEQSEEYCHIATHRIRDGAFANPDQPMLRL